MFGRKRKQEPYHCNCGRLLYTKEKDGTHHFKNGVLESVQGLLKIEETVLKITCSLCGKPHLVVLKEK